MDAGLFKQIQATCTFHNNDTVEPASECSALLSRMKTQVGGYDLYNIYDQCKLAGDDADLIYGSDLGDSPNLPPLLTLESLLGNGATSDSDRVATGAGLAPHDDRGGQCGQERALTAWANEPEVREALHVLSEADLGVYRGSTHLNYGRDEHNTYAIYQQLLAAGKRILVYSGDVDNCLPWTGSLQWVEEIGATLQQQPLTSTSNTTQQQQQQQQQPSAAAEEWRPWTLQGGAQMGGYVVQFSKQLIFATVRSLLTHAHEHNSNRRGHVVMRLGSIQGVKYALCAVLACLLVGTYLVALRVNCNLPIVGPRCRAHGT